MQPPDVELRTERTVVRLRRLHEAAELCAAVRASRQHLAPWIRWGAEIADESTASALIRREQAEWLLDENFVLGIFSSNGKTMLGGTGFHPRGGSLGDDTTEVGMWIHADHVGVGLATEVLVAMLQWGLSTWSWQRIEWRCDPRNLASEAVATKAGMTLEGTLRKHWTNASGRRVDSHVFAALRGEWTSPS